MKRVIALLIMLLVLSSCAASIELPGKFQDWTLAREDVVPLISDPDNKNFGRVIYCCYVRENPLGKIQVIITEGSGPGALYVPDKVKNSEGVFESSSGYEIVNVAEKRSVIETSENLPLSMAIRYDNMTTITLETNSLSKQELLNFAESLLSSL